MSYSDPNETAIAPITVPGGGTSGGLDLRDPKDQALLRQAIERWPGRWRGLDAAKRTRFLRQLEIAIDEADVLAQNPETLSRAAELRVSVVKTAVAIDTVQQREDMRIFDSIMGTGKSNAGVNINAEHVTVEFINSPPRIP